MQPSRCCHSLMSPLDIILLAFEFLLVFIFYFFYFLFIYLFIYLFFICSEFCHTLE